MLLNDLKLNVPCLLKGYYKVEEKQKNGKKYLVAVFTDLSGEMAHFTIFSNNMFYNIFKNCPNCYCECEITYNGENKGFKQYTFNNIKPLIDPNKGNLSDVSKLERELWNIVESIQNNNLKNVTTKILQESMPRYILAPASKMTGYSYEGGLISKTVRVCKLINKICDVYNSWNYTVDGVNLGLSRDLLITAAIIGDVGLINYYEIINNEVTVTTFGKLMGKSLTAASHCDAILKQYLSTKDYSLLYHIILTSHSKSYNVGVPTRTPEAELLASIKEMDSSMANIEFLLRIPSEESVLKLNSKEYVLDSFE